MNNNMEDYYKVLQYLRETHIDRQYPYTFDEYDSITSPCDIKLSGRYISDHKNTVRLEDIVKGDTIKIQLNTPRNYTTIETFEVLLYTTTILNKDSISIGFSNLKSGVINQTTLTSEDLIEDELVIPPNGGYYLFKYNVRKSNTQMQKKNRKNSSVSCINLTINKSIPICYISNIVARESQFNFTLEDLDELIFKGKSYVMNQLHVRSYENIPDPLKHLCFKSAGAYGFLVEWEVEGQKTNYDYAKTLFKQVNEFIYKFKEIEPIIGYTEFENYPVRKRLRL